MSGAPELPFTLELPAPPPVETFAKALLGCGIPADRIGELARAIAASWQKIRERLVDPKKWGESAGDRLAGILNPGRSPTSAELRSWTALAGILIDEQRGARRVRHSKRVRQAWEQRREP